MKETYATQFARLGGKARAAKLSKEEIAEIGRIAGKASGKARRARKKLQARSE